MDLNPKITNQNQWFEAQQCECHDVIMGIFYLFRHLNQSWDIYDLQYGSFRNALKETECTKNVNVKNDYWQLSVPKKCPYGSTDSYNILRFWYTLYLTGHLKGSWIFSILCR